MNKNLKYKEKYFDYKKKYLEYKKKILLQGGCELENNYQEKILDFRLPIEQIIIPEKFNFIDNRRMILYAGDGYRPRNKSRRYVTDIEYFTSRSPNTAGRSRNNFNIFCCLYDYSTVNFRRNIQYLSQHPELNIIICLIDCYNPYQLDKFSLIFNNSINLICSDDIRSGIPSNIAYDILVDNLDDEIVLPQYNNLVPNISGGGIIDRIFTSTNNRFIEDFTEKKNLYRDYPNIDSFYDNFYLGYLNEDKFLILDPEMNIFRKINKRIVDGFRQLSKDEIDLQRREQWYREGNCIRDEHCVDGLEGTCILNRCIYL